MSGPSNNILSFSPSGDFLISCRRDESNLAILYLWSLKTFELNISANENYLGFNSEDNSLITIAKNHTINVWSLSTLKVEHTFSVEGVPIAIALSPSGKFFASVVEASAESEIRIWSTSSGERVQTIKVENYHVFNLLFSKDENMLIAEQLNNRIKIWSINTGELIRSLDNGVQVYKITINPEGTILAVKKMNDR